MSATQWNLQWPQLQNRDIDTSGAIAGALGGAQGYDPNASGAYNPNQQPNDGAGSNWTFDPLQAANSLPSSWGGGASQQTSAAASAPGTGRGGGSGGGAFDGGGNWQTFTAPDVEGSFGSRWDAGANRWVQGTGGVAAGSNVGKTGAKIPVNYNPNADTFRHEFNGQAAEQSRTRVARWAGDNMRDAGMGAQDAYNAALARLKRDMGNNWQQSGFDLSGIQAAPAGNDRFVPQVQGMQGATPAPAAQTAPPAAAPSGVGATPPPATGAGGQQGQGGTGMAQPMGGGLATGDRAAVAAGGPGTALAGQYNAAHPEDVVNAYMRDHGVDPLGHTGFGNFMKSLMNKIVPTLFNTTLDAKGMQSQDMLANPMAMLGQIFGQGQLGGNLRGHANDVLGQLQGSQQLQNLDPEIMQRLLTEVNGLSNYGSNKYQALASQSGLDDALTGYDTAQYNTANTGQVDPRTLWQFLTQTSPGVTGRR